MCRQGGSPTQLAVELPTHILVLSFSPQVPLEGEALGQCLEGRDEGISFGTIGRSQSP